MEREQKDQLRDRYNGLRHAHWWLRAAERNMAAVGTRLGSVGSCHCSKPSTPPGEFSVIPLRAHARRTRDTQSWPGAHVLSFLIVSSAPFLLAQPYRAVLCASPSEVWSTWQGTGGPESQYGCGIWQV